MEYNKLKGKNLISVGRCADMPVLGFGDTITINRRGKQRKYPEYAFHIQCPFRIMKEKQIILGSYDIYCALGDENDSD